MLSSGVEGTPHTVSGVVPNQLTRGEWKMNPIDVQEIAFHRNGISGVGFYAVTFLWQPEDATGKEMFLAIVFDEPGECAVVGVDRIGTCGVKFAGGNSWRGDRFEDALRAAIKEGPTSGGHRMGPFCVPTDPVV